MPRITVPPQDERHHGGNQRGDQPALLRSPQLGSEIGFSDCASTTEMGQAASDVVSTSPTMKSDQTR